eukprot:CAMPEP_0185583114 /NCGR_PEP_ID=MMETSP0434-20130131/21325_1 /TAXON_ID=626734 ORGANISM="Favella taraikaensis, Strain Fe Narragansett Bay" /NCGR_SAMPLE_ID=MMETSP0434 /ASSEMBLY_ACC=CAM_ASM_000379 /LENGTH=99 /DNA_ID=CAMNT_0028202113 /DNA_START=1306 /DNA_END=1606 /DNA_ORIENTATION=-
MQGLQARTLPSGISLAHYSPIRGKLYTVLAPYRGRPAISPLRQPVERLGKARASARARVEIIDAADVVTRPTTGLLVELAAQSAGKKGSGPSFGLEASS